MAKKEIVNVITIKTEESQNTIKGLKREIADLKKNLDNAVIGSDEFEKASKDLAKAQNDLKTVLADGKKQTDNVEGSYNHLVSTMAELKKEWRATADEVKRNEIGKEIDRINTELKELDGSIGNFQRNVGNYAEDFRTALQEQADSTAVVRTKLEGLQKVASGLASGYAAVQGAMSLLNIENTKFEKAMIKIQSAMAIAQGIGGLKDLIEGFGILKTSTTAAANGTKMFNTELKGIKGAMAATGIGLLVVALGTVAAYWDDITDAIRRYVGTVEDADERLSIISERQGAITTDIVRRRQQLNRELKIAAANGATELEIAEKRAAATKEIYDIQQDYYDELDTQYRDAEFYNNQGAILTDFQQKVLNEYPALIETAKKYLDDYREQWKDAITDVEVAKIKSIGTSGTTSGTTSGSTSFIPPKQESILSQLSEELDLEEELFAASRERMVTLNEEANKQMLEQVKEFGKKETDRIREEAEKQKIIRETLKDNYLSLASNMFSSISTLIGQETAVGKAAAVAQTTIDTYQSATKAYKSALEIPIVGIKIAPVAAAAAVLAGLANIKSILSVNTDGISKGIVNTSSPTASPTATATAAAIPNINLADSLPIQYSRELLTDSETTNLNQAQKVIVLESDISTVQRKVEVAESNSSF